MRKRLKKLALILLVPFLLLVTFLVFERIRGRIGLAHYKRELIAKGEKLDARDFMTTPSKEENGAPELWAAVKELKEGPVLPKNPAPRMRLTELGRAIVCFREDE